MLKRILAYTENMEEREEALKEAKKHRLRYAVGLCKNITRDKLDLLVDIVMGFVISSNALAMGLSMDYGLDSTTCIIVDCLFTALFFSEMVVKIALHGYKEHFWGPSRTNHFLDALTLLTDITQLILFTAWPSATLLRLVRLMKLTRLLRVLQLQVFDDVLTMIQGIIGGMGTLMWSLVLYVVMVYIMALLCRTMFGTTPVDNVYDFFKTVPRSMFTTFRCSFGDCTTTSGQPIFEFVHEGYGTVASILYCFFVFGVSIGVFNVISAIFIESTLAAAAALEKAQKDERLQDERRWKVSITKLIRNICEVAEQSSGGEKLSDIVESIYQIDLQKSLLDELVKRPEVKEALDDLDINPDDHCHLSELLDPDNGGTISVVDLVDGLRRLRGEPRRSDVVHVNMMVRSLQLVVTETQTAVLEMQSRISHIHDALSPNR